MFNDVIGKWKYSEKNIRRNIHDSVGASLKQSLLMTQNKISMHGKSIFGSRTAEKVINNLLCELRRIV